MAKLTDEQIRNLERDGYVVKENGENTIVEKWYPDGSVTRQTVDSEGVKKTDMYFGDVRKPDDHDRFTVKHGDEKPLSGHGPNHEPWRK